MQYRRRLLAYRAHYIVNQVISYNVGGTMIAVLKSTLLRFASGSVLAARFERKDACLTPDDMEDGHICMVSRCSVCFSWRTYTTGHPINCHRCTNILDDYHNGFSSFAFRTMRTLSCSVGAFQVCSTRNSQETRCVHLLQSLYFMRCIRVYTTRICNKAINSYHIFSKFYIQHDTS